MACMNTKVAAGMFLMQPFACVNDGLLDFIMLKEKKTSFGSLMRFNQQVSKKGGVHGYREDMDFIRGKSLKVINKNTGKAKKGVPGLKPL